MMNIQRLYVPLLRLGALSLLLAAIVTAGSEVLADEGIGCYYDSSTRGVVIIRFLLEKEEPDVALYITDLDGREIARPIDSQRMKAGEHAISVDTGTLTPGIYFYTLRLGAKIETRRLEIGA